MIDRKKLRELAEKATPGLWQYWSTLDKTKMYVGVQVDDWGPKLSPFNTNDLDFIVGANPKAILELLDLLDETERAISNVIPAIESGECRNDEDCDHCVYLQILQPALDKIRGET